MTTARSDALVLGDLAHEKLFPALQAMVQHGRLDVPVIGVARADWNLDKLRAYARDSLENHPRGLDRAAFDKLASLLRFVNGDGVPFYIRAGKQLPVTCVEVIVEMKRPPRAVFDETVAGRANHLRFRLSLACEMAPYERLLGDAIDGDPTRFTREDAVEASWRIVDPILDGKTPVHAYDPETWGPSQVAELLAPPGGWHDPVVARGRRT